MKYAIISDIHSNYEALKVVLEDTTKRGVEHYVVCGDIIGYGPQPVECVEEIRKLNNVSFVLGNHDAVIAGKIDIKWFNDYAKKSLEITANLLSDETKAWFSNIPLKIEEQFFTVVHGSPKNPLKEYLLSEMQCSENIKLLNTQILFYGHTHIPMYFCLNSNNRIEGDFLKPFAKIKLNECIKFFVNPGSVGQPRDGNPMASYGVFDSQSMIFELVRVNYDVKKVQDLMKKQGMHQLLIERLEFGY